MSTNLFTLKIKSRSQLRLLIYCLSFGLMSIQYKILTFPFYKYVRWLTGSYEASNVSMDFLSCRRLNNVELLEFELKLYSSVPWKTSAYAVKNESHLTKPLSIAQFAKFLVKGDMMAFLPKI